MYSGYKKALEENLCYQSNLAISLLLFVDNKIILDIEIEEIIIWVKLEQALKNVY